MDESTTPHICETCGQPYTVDDTVDQHMNPPDDYRRGCQRYCLACWLGVGPMDETDPAAGAGRPVRRNHATPRHMRWMERTRQSSGVYLWFCCEGWMKFGPFEWLRFDDECQSIIGPNGDEVATKVDGRWRVPGEKWQGWGFSNPTITTTPRHPHRNSSAHPARNH
ncbi:MAG: hypothetical protein ACQCXQ_00595 [Verrucomicrobiales bacterium]|nr:hypothetical protein [Verrucomicrobiota bacterium JB025]